MKEDTEHPVLNRKLSRAAATEPTILLTLNIEREGDLFQSQGASCNARVFTRIFFTQIAKIEESRRSVDRVDPLTTFEPGHLRFRFTVYVHFELRCLADSNRNGQRARRRKRRRNCRCKD